MLIVQKYGGSSLSLPQQIKSVARRIADLYEQGHQLIIVVSAMGNSTDQLVDLAYSISPQPNRRELDMLVSTGERVSMSLMSMALSDLGCPAISFTGSQAGLMTNPSHSNARIIDLKPIRVREELDKGKIVVLAGFQGVNPDTKEITTLGRGGSDTTAVAMASHFRADACQIMKEFAGVYSADPRLVTSAQTLEELTYGELIDISYWGGRMIHHRAALLASDLKIPLYLGCAQDPSSGTNILDEVNMFEEGKVLSVNSIPEVHHYAVTGDDMGHAMQMFFSNLDSAKLPAPRILASVFDEETNELRMMATSSEESLKSVEQMVEQSNGMKVLRKPLSSVTVTCRGYAGPEMSLQVSTQLRENQIPIYKLLTSPLSVSVFVEPKLREKCVQVLSQPD